MSDTTLIPSDQDKTPASYATEPPRYMDYAELPPGVTLRPEGIALKHHIGVVSTMAMVLTSFITFWMPVFNGLLGGLLGGYHAGNMKRALGAAVVSSAAVPGLLWFLNFMSEQPGLLFLMGLSFKEWIIAHVIGTFLGAIAGVYSRPKFTERDLYQSAR
jgi:hypothetical protein